MPLKIGVLAPNSTYIPFLARDIKTALTLGLQDIEHELFIEPCGYNVERNMLADKLQELVVKHMVDIVVAPLNAGLLEHVNAYVGNEQIPMIVNTMGEDVVFLEAQHPYLFVNSFNLWQSTWMAGYWGAEQYGKKACTSCALHDAGYGMTFSFGLGLEAKDGYIAQTTVTHRAASDEDPTPSIEMLAENQPDFIQGFYSGKEAVSFLKTYDQLGYKDKIPLLGLPLAVDELILDDLGDAAEGIHSIYCWTRNSKEHQQYDALFKEQSGRSFNSYSLMAFETGHMIAQAVEQLGSDKHLSVHLPEALKSVEFNGPRGVIKFDAEREVRTTDHLHTVARDDQGRLYNKPLQALEIPDLFYEQLALARKKLSKNGWLNPYLIA